MASDGNSGKIPNASPVHGSQATNSIRPQLGSGKPLPPSGKTVAAAERPAATAERPAATAVPGVKPAPAAQQSADPQTLVNQLNSHLNDSGFPDQFRLDPTGKQIQQVNPATGKVVGEFSVSEFPALARSVGASGLLLDSLA
jgi:hypothetical protein